MDSYGSLYVIARNMAVSIPERQYPFSCPMMPYLPIISKVFSTSETQLFGSALVVLEGISRLRVQGLGFMWFL